MKRYFLGISVALFACLFMSAQDMSQMMEAYGKLSVEKDSLEKVVKSQTILIDHLKETMANKDSVIASCTAQIKNLNNMDSVAADSIKKLNLQIEAFNKEQPRFDQVRLRYANGRLQLPYNEASVKEALELYEEISDPELKEKYSDITLCLREYPIAKEQVKETIIELEKSKANFNRFQLEEWKKAANVILNNNTYLKGSSKYHNGVSIYFLDNILKEAQEKIKRADKLEEVSFKDLNIRIKL